MTAHMSTRRHSCTLGLVPTQVILAFSMLAAIVGATPVGADIHIGGAALYSMNLLTGWSVLPVSASTPKNALGSYESSDNMATMIITQDTIPTTFSSLDWANRDYQDNIAQGWQYRTSGTTAQSVAGSPQPIVYYTFTDSDGSVYNADAIYVANGASGWTLWYFTADGSPAIREREYLTMAASFGFGTDGTQPAISARQFPASLPLGKWICYNYNPPGYYQTALITLQDASTYTVLGGTAGQYKYDASTGVVTFTSGGYASEYTGQVRAETELSILFTGKTSESVTMKCVAIP